MTGPTPSATLRRVENAERPRLESLVSDYLRELGESKADYPYLSLYWSEPGRHAYFIEQFSSVVGFALVRQLEGGSEWEVAEFSVSRSHRRQGIGTEVFKQLAQLHSGAWHIETSRSNAAGSRFWPLAIHALQQEQSCEVHFRLRGDANDA